MKAVRLHAVGDLRMHEEAVPLPGRRGDAGAGGRGRHLRIGSALVRAGRDRRRAARPRRSSSGMNSPASPTPAGGWPSTPRSPAGNASSAAREIPTFVKKSFLPGTDGRTGRCGNTSPGQSRACFPIPETIEPRRRRDARTAGRGVACGRPRPSAARDARGGAGVRSDRPARPATGAALRRPHILAARSPPPPPERGALPRRRRLPAGGARWP